MADEQPNSGFAAMDAHAQETAAAEQKPEPDPELKPAAGPEPEPELLALPAPEGDPEPDPKDVLRAKLLAAREKVATAKKRLMLDDLADGVCDALTAMIDSLS